jgi:hypothetical protein
MPAVEPSASARRRQHLIRRFRLRLRNDRTRAGRVLPRTVRVGGRGPGGGVLLAPTLYRSGGCLGGRAVQLFAHCCSPILVDVVASRLRCCSTRLGWWRRIIPSGARPANCRWPRRDALPSRPWVSDTRALDPSCQQQLRARRSFPTPPGQRWHPQRSVSASSFKVLPAALLMCCGADPDTAVDCSRRTLDASSVVSSLADSLRPWTAGTRLSEIGCGAWKR